ncbi:ThiF family adenylyltransferase [Robiginitalea marina]|uniref:HesA/MoeB/ThiF family protein n=1 Tax=Robiginitalea marina TaxID=2954105 RepID=A0ABT1AU97_9FLAO|nr:HesA/MoeB/ThiF family protein [Robiginitalea marina]
MTHSRYDRQERLKGFGAAGQERLRQARILVVGAGGLGVPVCQYLNAMGVGTLGIADGDTVEETNLHRQPLYGPEDLGKSKVAVLAEKLHRQNPDTRIDSHATFVLPGNALELLELYDLVVDATDRIPTRYLLDDACAIRGIPWIYGALHGFEGQLSVFNYRGGPTYRCLFPQAPRPGEIPDCNQLGTLGVLPGVIGTLQALEAVKVVCGLGEILSGKLLLFNALDHQSRQIRFSRAKEEGARQLYSASQYLSGFCDQGGSISVAQYRNILRDGTPHTLVDVREAREFKALHIPGSRNIPLLTLEQELGDLDGPAPVYLICETGSRSAQGYQKLKGRLEHAEVHWIAGGVRDLIQEPVKLR